MFKSVVGIIHNPTPATPLCTYGKISSHLVDPSMKNDEKRLQTVRSRDEAVEEYLQANGQLYVVYPQEGLQKRSLQQQKIFYDKLLRFPEVLFNTAINESLPSNMVGATYIATTKTGKQLAFSIRASHANAPSNSQNWELWLGELHNKKIHHRVSSILKAIYERGGPKLNTLIFK